MGILLDRSALLRKEELKRVQVDLGDGDYVFVRQMTGRERDLFEQSLVATKKDEKGNVTGYEQTLEDFRAKLAVVTLCDEFGIALLKPGDFQILSQNMSAAKLEKIVEVAQGLNKISDKDKSNLIKNSDAVPDGNSNSGSVEN